MKQLLNISILLLFVSSFAQANIVCIGETSSGAKGRVEITKDSVIVTGGLLSRPHIIKKLNRENELITGPGIAITMKNYYGCYRNAVIITEFNEPFRAGYMEVMNVATCSGGSTADELCLPTN